MRNRSTCIFNGTLVLVLLGPFAAAARVTHHKAKGSSAVQTLSAPEASSAAQLRNLTSQVRDLQASEAETRAELREALAAVRAAKTQVDATTTLAAETQAAERQAEVATIVTEVQTAVGAVKPSTDKIHYKGVDISLGGFVEAANQYRSRALGSDMFTPFNAIPFANTPTGHEAEDRLSARATRVSALVQGKINPTTQVAMYGEFDFLGAAQTANSIESNSYNPRVRHLYGTLDWNDLGWHVLAGQSWTLATMNSKGITPRNEVTPPQIDAQFVPGFVWIRQPQFRLTKDLLNHNLWLAVSVENPQTTFTGNVPAGVVSSISNSLGLFDGTTNGSPPSTAGDPSNPVVPTNETSSLNHVPDVAAKIAYELPFYKRAIHLKAFGIGRAFTDRMDTREDTVYSGGVGGGVILPLVPGVLDIQGSALSGRGVGRYGTSLLPDVTFRNDGRIEPIGETDILFGGTLHATKMLDVYAFAGEEHENRKAYSGGYGYGSSTVNNSGCFTEGGTCGAATKLVEQATLGFWQQFYQGPLGHIQFGVQYSYTQRDSFSGLGGLAPVGKDNIVYTSFRYYPF